jgi:hypothetical protein
LNSAYFFCLETKETKIQDSEDASFAALAFTLQIR